MKIQIDEARLRHAIRKYTQAKLARRLGISQPSISKKLKEVNRLRIEELSEICEIIGEDARKFIVFDDEHRAEPKIKNAA